MEHLLLKLGAAFFCGIILFVALILIRERRNMSKRHKTTSIRVTKVVPDTAVKQDDAAAADAALFDKPEPEPVYTITIEEEPSAASSSDDNLPDDQSSNNQLGDDKSRDDQSSDNQSENIGDDPPKSIEPVKINDDPPPPPLVEKTSAPKPVPAPPAKKRRIPDTVKLKERRLLLAEDVEANRDLIAACLDGTGVIVDRAENGMQACEKFEECPDAYSLILMDTDMPVMDGYEAARRIRSLDADWAKQIPIVALTADAMKGDIDLCFDAGMDDYLSKPIDADALLDKIFELIQSSGE